MGRNINDVVAALPKARREKVEAKAKQLSKEMIAYADSISAIRKAAEKTQLEISRKLKIGQGSVAQLEGRKDYLLSTLHKYVSASGYKLQIYAEAKNGARIELSDIGNPDAKSGLSSRAPSAGKPTRESKRKITVSARSN
jgi:hypothetical protein